MKLRKQLNERRIIRDSCMMYPFMSKDEVCVSIFEYLGVDEIGK